MKKGWPRVLSLYLFGSACSGIGKSARNLRELRSGLRHIGKSQGNCCSLVRSRRGNIASLRLITSACEPRTSSSHSFAGQLAGLLHPGGELSFVELVLVDVEVAHFLVLGLAGWDRMQRRAAEESHFDVLREAMKAEEPALAL